MVYWKRSRLIRWKNWVGLLLSVCLIYLRTDEQYR